MFKFKKKQPKLNFSDIFPIIDWQHINKTKSDVFKLKNGRILDILQINTKDLVAGNFYDIRFDMIQFAKFMKKFPLDFKIIKMTYPVDVSEQIQFIKYKITKTTNPIYLKELNKELELLSLAKETASSTDFYLMIFAKNENEYIQAMENIFKSLIHHKIVFPIDFKKKIKIEFKLNNLNSNLNYLTIPDDIKQGIDKGKKLNYELLSLIQPVGGVSCKDERIVTKSDGYEACIEIYKYKNQVTYHWLNDVINFENSVCTIDVSPADKAETITSINRSMEEQNSRYYQARNTKEEIDAQKMFNHLATIYKEMTDLGEVMKNVIIRIYVFGKTREELEKHIANIISNLQTTGGFEGVVYLEENERQLEALHLPIKKQINTFGASQVQSIPSEVIAMGYPFHFSQLLDPCGDYLGNTSTDGLVYFDNFHKDKTRLSYNNIIFGLTSSGKSTLLKKLMKFDIITGNYVRGYTTNEEFDKLINYFGGKVINLDGTDGIINILHIYKTSEDEANNYTAHISKVKSWYQTLCPEADSYDLSTLGDLVKLLYKKHLNYDENTSHKITELPATSYPILSDLLLVVEQEMQKYSDSKDYKYKRIEQIHTILNDIINNYSKVFNGYSSIEDFSKEKIVMFSVKNLSNFGDKIFNAQMYSSLSLLFDNLIQIGLPQKQLADERNLSKLDTTYYRIYIDEAHKFINTRRPNETQFVVDFEREARKYFGGITLATQNLSDMIKPAITNDNNIGVENIKALFELSQYKFIFKQDSNTMDLLSNTFRADLPESEIDKIPTFETGECMLVISGLTSVHLFVSVSEEDLERFAGGI